MSPNTFNVLPKYKNKQEIAYDEIKNAIITCRFQPGDQLVIRTLAAQLGISEIPVREALKRLISENYVTENGSALTVSAISADDFVDMLEVKLDLEMIAIKVAARNITDEQIEYLKSILESMEECYHDNNLKEYRKEHSRFHLECALTCDVPYLMTAISSSFGHHERAINYFNLSSWEQQPSLQDHSDIMNALMNHDPEAAQKHLHENRERAYTLYRKQMAEIISKQQ